MTLVFISHDGHCTGGAQKCLFDLIKGIRQLHPDWKIYVIFPGYGGFTDLCKPYINGFRIIHTEWWLRESRQSGSISRKIRYIFRFLRSSLKIMRYLVELHPDFAMTNTITIPHLAFACKILGIRHCWFLHEIPELSWKNICFVFPQKFTFGYIRNFSDTILTPSVFARDYYRNHLHFDNIYDIKQSVELKRYPASNNIGRHVFTVIMVGAFDSNKGQVELLQAIRLLRESGKDIQCILAGADAGGLQTCEEYIKSNCLDKYVTLLPFSEDVHKYYGMADAVVICSETETFCRVAVEAHLCGLPVILSDRGANPERITDGKDGLLYRKGNVRDLASKIELLEEPGKMKAFKANIHPDEVRKTYGMQSFAADFCKISGLDSRNR